MRAGIVLLCSLASFVSIATGLRWIEDDTVIVTNELPPPGRFQRDLFPSSSEYVDAIVRTPYCKTTRGNVGTCRSLRECYPVLFPMNKNSSSLPQGTLNNGLASILVGIAGICDIPVEPKVNEEMLMKVADSEYLICCTEPEEVPVPSPLPPPKEPEKDNSTSKDDERKGQRNCGSLKVDPGSLPALNGTRVVKGREAARGEFPWIVALMNKGKEFCGSSLISSEWVVTAAHCVQHMREGDVANLRLQIGDHDIYSTSDGVHEVRSATRVLFHKGFNMQHLHHDVALIKLSSPVRSTNLVQPICLHSGGYLDGQIADVTGWGQLYENGPQPSRLQTARVPIVSQEECAQKYEGIAPAGIGNGMICAGGTGPDSCRGDSGGPLTVDSRSNPRLAGIVSFGVECGTLPGVYTRPSAYQSWISKNSNTY